MGEVKNVKTYSKYKNNLFLNPKEQLIECCRLQKAALTPAMQIFRIAGANHAKRVHLCSCVANEI